MTRLPWETSRADLAREIRSKLKKAGVKNYRVRSGRPNATDCLSVYVYHWMHERGGPDWPARTKTLTVSAAGAERTKARRKVSAERRVLGIMANC